MRVAECLGTISMAIQQVAENRRSALSVDESQRGRVARDRRVPPAHL